MTDTATKCYAADGVTQVFDFPHGTPLMVRAVDFNALYAERQALHDALAALLALPVAKKELESLRKGIGTATPNAAWLHAARLLGDT